VRKFLFFFLLSLSLTQLSYCYNALYTNALSILFPLGEIVLSQYNLVNFLTIHCVNLDYMRICAGANFSRGSKGRPALIELVLTQWELTFKWSYYDIFVCSVTCLEVCVCVCVCVFSCYWMPLVLSYCKTGKLELSFGLTSAFWREMALLAN